MDNPKQPHSPPHLLDDLESIREFLLGSAGAKPLPLDSLDPRQIPLLSDVVPAPAPQGQSHQPQRPADPAPVQVATPAAAPPAAAPRPASEPAVAASVAARLQRATQGGAEPPRLSGELRAAAQLILQDVLDDFVPQIEAELRRRLEARLDRLVAQRKG
ncbi:MAG: DNA polymerase III subunit chi [Pseudomonadota bacterium]